MSASGKNSVAHVCILVKDIDRAIEHFSRILSVTAPALLEKPLEKRENFAGKDRYYTVFFRAPGDGCDIQLLQPLNTDSPLYKRLEKYGEGVHHIAFASDHLEENIKGLREKEVTLNSDKFSYDVGTPDIRWMWIMPSYAHGVLIEVMDAYEVVNGSLVKNKATR